MTRQRHAEDAPAAFSRQAIRIATMLASNLPHQRQPEPDAAAGFAGAAGAIERFEHALALAFSNASAAVQHVKFNTCRREANNRFRTTAAMTHGVLQQIADQPLQQAGVAPKAGELGLQGDVGPSTLLGHDRCEIDRLELRCRATFQATGEENLVDQLIEFRDVAREFVAPRRPTDPWTEVQRRAGCAPAET